VYLLCLWISDNCDKRESALKEAELDGKKEKSDDQKKETEVVSEQLSKLNVSDDKKLDEKEAVGDAEKVA
jgi:hypothetical protein